MQALAKYCPDLAEWPQRWSYEPRDIAPGQRIVEFFQPFLLYLLDQGLARKTLHRHRDHLWMLGGHVIHEFQLHPERRRRPIERTIIEMIDTDEGPLLWPDISEQAQESFDATCRKLYKFVVSSKSPQ